MALQMLGNVSCSVSFHEHVLNIYDTLGIVLGAVYRDEKAGTLLSRGFEFNGNT